jgi:glycosyltransferase involved in cell wall biosynthesis
MFYKKIVIAADIGGPGELIENGVNGFLIQPQNVKELEKIMLDCISNFNSERMNLIREKAFSDASEKFNLKRFSENYQKLFDDILITT